MKIKFTDSNKEPLSNIEVTFLTNGGEFVYVTNAEGIVEFFEAKKGDKIVCYTTVNEKREFVFNEKELPEIMVEAPLVDMIFVTIGNDEESVIGAKVFFEYLGNKIEKTSDNTGQIVLEKIPVNTDVKVYQVYKDREYNAEINRCKKDKAQYFIVTNKDFEFSDMKFKLVDKSGQIIRNADIRFKIGNKEFETVTDHLGIVKIENIRAGETVECKQMIFGKSLPWHSFKCDDSINEYILHGEKATFYSQNSEKLDSQVRMRFRLINSKLQPIPNAVLRLEYGINVRNKYTNQSGEAMVEDIMIGDKVKAMVSLQGKKTEAEFICQNDDEMHEIVFKSNNKLVYLWIIPLLVIIAAIVYFTGNFSGDESEEADIIVPKKDSLIFKDYKFYISATRKAVPVAGSRIKLIYNDMVSEMQTDKNGFANFRAVDKKVPQSIEISALGYLTLKKTFSPDSIFRLKLAEDDSVDIALGVLPCSSLIESKDKKMIVREFKMNINSGNFKIWYNLFDFPALVEIYNGKTGSISDKNLIYSSKTYMRGISNPAVNFSSPDSTVTVKISGKTSKSAWVFKVYCARKNQEIVN
ncbi:MAG: hypothetical protein U0W24_21150 [Bacteroidales bacterium]